MKRLHHNISRNQIGASLIVSLILLMVTSMLGISATQIAIEASKAARGDRDHEVAFQAAEAALQDAESDIENSPDSSRSRSHLFSRTSSMGFPDDGEAGCNSGTGNIFLGLCSHSVDSAKSVWLTANLAGDPSLVVDAVPYGTFTGRSFQFGKGNLPCKPPRYIIELLVYNRQGESAEQVSYFYRVTALGFGAQESTKVVLQTFYRKAG
jgi:type IV pilus assembly protein PilX